jgi:hypothetical protein
MAVDVIYVGRILSSANKCMVIVCGCTKGCRQKLNCQNVTSRASVYRWKAEMQDVSILFIK